MDPRKRSMATLLDLNLMYNKALDNALYNDKYEGVVEKLILYQLSNLDLVINTTSTALTPI